MRNVNREIAERINTLDDLREYLDAALATHNKYLIRIALDVAKRSDYLEQARSAKAYTQEEIDYMRDNAKSLGAREIGRKLGRTPEAIIMKCKTLGISLSKKYSDEFIKNVLADVNRGMSIKAAAKKHKVSYSAALSWARNMKVQLSKSQRILNSVFG